MLSSGGGAVATAQSRQLDQTFVAQVLLSQLLFDFGKNLAETEARRKLAEVAVEDMELQRQLISLTVKEAYTNTLFSQRLIRVQEQASGARRAQPALGARASSRSARGPKSDVARAEVDVANAQARSHQGAERRAERRRRPQHRDGASTWTRPTQIVDNLVYQPVTLDRAAAAQPMRSASDPNIARPSCAAAAAEAQGATGLPRLLPRHLGHRLVRGHRRRSSTSPGRSACR